MTAQENRDLWLHIAINPHNPNFLAGLDSLLALGLIDDRQVRNLCQTNLTCPLQLPIITKLPAVLPVDTTGPAVSVGLQPSLARNIWAAFKNELSVRWLLFLGVFLVILSSGVLAATQWQSFPAWGQYGVLWAYTIVFWVVGFWASSQPGLTLTAHTLKIVALLLVPVNFWAIDSFQLWQQPLGWVTTGWALLSLSCLVFVDSRYRQQQGRFRATALAYLGGSYLQLGWQLAGWATIAVYVAAIGAIGIWQCRRYFFRNRFWQWANLGAYSLTILLLRALFVAHLPLYNFGLVIGMIGWLVAQWELQAWRKIDRIDDIIHRLGATEQRINELTRQRATAESLSRKYRAIATLFLGCAWLIAIGQWGSNFFIGSSWQPFAVDVLILAWLSQRLWLRRRAADIITMFIVGLQTYAVSFALATDFLANLVKWDIWAQLQPIFGENAPWALVLVLIPYLLLWVGIWSWLLKHREYGLTETSESLIFIGGLVLNLLSVPNHLGLLLNLAISTLALIYIVQRHPLPHRVLIYVTHGYGWATIAAGIQYAFPALQALHHQLWPTLAGRPRHQVLGAIGLIVTILAIGEWLVSTLSAVPGSKRDLWYRSAWHYGLGMGTMSYVAYGWAYNSGWTWGWFLLPIALTGLASHESTIQVEIPRIRPWQIDRQDTAAIWSIGGLLLAPGLTLDHWDWRCWGLGLAVGLMFFNVRRLRNWAAAAIHVGFGLALMASLLERVIAGSHWFVVGSIGCVALWIAVGQLRRRSGDLALLYARASDQWALGLGLVGVAIGLINYGANHLGWFWGMTPVTFFPQQQSIAMGSVILAVGLCYRQHLFSQSWHLWAINITLQLGLSAIVQLGGGNALTLAIVNVVIAFSLLWSTGKLRNWLDESATNSMLPWVYGCWGLCLRLPYFNAYTGLLTILLGIVSLWVGRGLRGLMVSYFGLLAIALGCYELLAYQVLQAPGGGNIADALTIFGVVTALLALGYRLWILGWERRGHTHWLNIPVARVQSVAHLHWAVASGWKLAAALVPPLPAPQFTSVHLVTSVLLGIYAVVQGRAAARHSQSARDDWWVYVGMAEILGTGMYARSLFSGLGFVDELLILMACLVGIVMMLNPWSKWGWRDRPWQNIAIVLPLLRVIFVAEEISIWNLLLIASFYGAIARRQRRFVWIYASLIFLNWAAFRVLALYELRDPLWFATILGVSLLTGVHFDPYFRPREQRRSRHLARLWASGAITLVALIFHQSLPLLPAGISLLLVLGGIALSIRAFLYVGTITLLLTASYQLIILMTEYSLTKWVVGLIAGVLIIAIAGNFERRREQIYTAISGWLDRLQEWQ
jgi:hypothetical protein